MRAWQRVRVPVLIVLVTVCVWLLLPSQPPAPAPPDAPNVILLSIDTLRRDHLPMYGYTRRDTAPHLAALAEEGIVFDQAMAVHTNTGPAHASMLTGLYPLEHGLRLNGMTLDPQWDTLAQVLQSDGYATGAFVSGFTLNHITGLSRGFDAYDDRGLERPARETWASAEAWLAPHLAAKRRFFLFLHLFDPHFEYTPPAEIMQRVAPEYAAERPPEHQVPGLRAESLIGDTEHEAYAARYDAEIASADAVFGQLVSLLKQHGAWDDTLLLFTSDHGETLWEREWVFDHGGRAYDEQMRIPLILRLPRAAHAGKRVAAPVSQVDYAPTLLAALGRDQPHAMRGLSLLPWLRGQGVVERPMFAHARTEPERVPEIAVPLEARQLATAVRLPPYKLIEYPTPDGGQYQQLFDLAHDPGERSNLVERHPDVAARLHRLLADFRGDVDGKAPRFDTPGYSRETADNLKALGYMH